MKGAMAMAMAAMIAAVSTPATAAPRCVTPYQLQALVHVALPSFVDAAVARCTPLLPGSAYLARQGVTLRQRFVRPTDVDGDAVRAGLGALVGKDAPASVTNDVAVALLASGLVKEFGLEKMTADQCRSTSMILEPLDALPRDRFEALLGTILAVASKKDGRLVMCGVTP